MLHLVTLDYLNGDLMFKRVQKDLTKIKSFTVCSFENGYNSDIQAKINAGYKPEDAIRQTNAKWRTLNPYNRSSEFEQFLKKKGLI